MHDDVQLIMIIVAAVSFHLFDVGRGFHGKMYELFWYEMMNLRSKYFLML